MNHFTTILIIINLLGLSNSWVQLTKATQLLQTLLPPNLTNFITASSYTNYFIVIFGGNNGTANFDKTFIIYLNNSTGQEILTSIRPSSIINPCGVVWQDAFYLYGEAQQTNQFWKLNLTTKTWRQINKTMQPMRICSLQMFENNNLLLFGASYQNYLNVQVFNVTTQAFQLVNVNFTSHVTVEVTQWDGSLTNVTIPIEMAPPGADQYIYSQFPSYFNYKFQISSSLNQTKKLLQIKGRAYSLYFEAETKKLYIRFLSTNGKFETSAYTSSVSFQDLSIFCFYQSSTKNFYMQYKINTLSKNFRVDSNTPNYYSQTWPNFTSSYGVFSLLIIKQLKHNTFSCILLVIHSTFAVYALHQNVYNQQYPVGVADSIFGVNQCQPGYRGSNCTQTACQNSLYINSQDKLRVIQFECSGHGKCSNGTCICDSYWGGQDCSIYLRKNCKGNLVTNFPLANCQCMNTTLGSNDCSVKFCPNDCTQHGTCQNGSCVCNQYYFGVDCSIMIIQMSS